MPGPARTFVRIGNSKLFFDCPNFAVGFRMTGKKEKKHEIKVSQLKLDFFLCFSRLAWKIKGEITTGKQKTAIKNKGC